MAIGTIHLFPGLVLIKRMLERHTINIRLHRVGRTLTDESVTRIAGSSDRLARWRNMLTVMTAETPRRGPVADIIRIRVPAGFHFREEVVLIYNDDLFNAL